MMRWLAAMVLLVLVALAAHALAGCDWRRGWRALWGWALVSEVLVVWFPVLGATAAAIAAAVMLRAGEASRRRRVLATLGVVAALALLRFFRVP